MDIAKEMIQTGVSMVKSGLVKGTWGNISIRHGENMWITPSGIAYGDLTPEDIAVVEIITGKQVGGRQKPSSEIPLHLIIYQNLEEVHSIVHTHSIYASAFAAMQEEIPCYTEDHAQIIGGSIPVAKYAFPGTTALAENVLRIFRRDRYAGLMAKHGLVTIGRSLREAWTAAEIAEKSAQVASVIRGMGKNPKPIEEEEIAQMRKIYLESYSKEIIKF
ncbi:L-fuculose-phosphate aldolase [Anaerosolibacter carboniphilus]|uniref:L-fuculose-phosphate aldolase n=1 Tax=Anaerosolibacter carboniphilus TaxID=1417629 RepID=A0A841KZQ9_9FIRM|nr:class II aldolase/adducin family protein [Anaerosolibacter carboniphilus]MBB6218847.1 L-fuculose-phosphate aldolase [Anaerosolibacter carboniphilus]